MSKDLMLGVLIGVLFAVVAITAFGFFLPDGCDLQAPAVEHLHQVVWPVHGDFAPPVSGKAWSQPPE